MTINNEYLKEWRKAKNLTQMDVAKIIDSSDSYVSLVESGKTNFSLDNLQKLEKEGFSVAKYLGIEDVKNDLQKNLKDLIIKNEAKDLIIKALRQSRDHLESELSIYYAIDNLTPKKEGGNLCN